MFFDLFDPSLLLSLIPDDNSIFPEFLALILPYNEQGLGKICINEDRVAFKQVKEEFWMKLICNCPTFQ